MPGIDRRAFDAGTIAAAAERFNVACEIRPLKSIPWLAVSQDGRVFACDAPRGKLPRVREKHRYEAGKNRLRVAASTGPGSSRYYEVGHLVAEAFLPPRPSPDSVLRHLDDDPRNNHAGNLAWGSAKDNYDDAVRNGRIVAQPLSATDAEPIRVTTTQAAKMLAIDVRTVRKHVAEGLFSVITPNGERGRGKRLFLLPEEVKVFGLHGAAALKAYREASTPKPKKRGK